jgi:hypothetical protein
MTRDSGFEVLSYETDSFLTVQVVSFVGLHFHGVENTLQICEACRRLVVLELRVAAAAKTAVTDHVSVGFNC